MKKISVCATKNILIWTLFFPAGLFAQMCRDPDGRNGATLRVEQEGVFRVIEGANSSEE